jgi:adenosine deaminase
MDIKRALIEVIFSKMPVEIIISKLLQNKVYSINASNIQFIQRPIIQYLFEALPGHSEDERNHAYNMTVEILKANNAYGIFSLLNNFNDEVLVEYSYKPYCRYDQLLRWRMLSHRLEQDLFITSYFAKNDLISHRDRVNFTWEPIIRTDNSRLHNLLQKGMAENHFHLKGSAPYFNLSWISLMNRITGRDSEYISSRILENRLNEDIFFEDSIEKQSIMSLVSKAAIIRAFLFENLLISDGVITTSSFNFYDILRITQSSSEEVKVNLREYNSYIESLKQQFGYNFISHGYDKVPDYAIKRDCLTEDNNNFKLLLYGERKFMYDCFMNLFNPLKNHNFRLYETLFYIYILIKVKFRSELVQVNNRIGFKNFSDYQDRKTIFLKDDPILKDSVYYMSIQATKQEQNILSLEARICNEESAAKTNNEIKKIDNLLEKTSKTLENSLFGDIESAFLTRLQNEHDEGKNNYKDLQINKTEKHKDFFYVIHIPKFVDQVSQKTLKNNRKYELPLSIRDIERRTESKKVANQLMEIREKRAYASDRILGIDACSNEIGCRPEVFSQAFRVLKYHTLSKENDLLRNRYLGVSYKNVPSLKITYHVGEDFLDLADGLRSIDEAIIFLNLSHGERLGHALALGVDVDEWYSSKGNNILLSKQDYLDNLAWILNKITHYKLDIDSFLKDELENEFNEYYRYIYYHHDTYQDLTNHRIYFNSWMLRGDDPYLYKTGKFKKCEQFRFWDRCSINKITCIKEDFRLNPQITNLYYRYHFDFSVRKRGYESTNIKVNKDYIKLIKLIQQNMQIEVRKLGIGIETNPSSNYLISTFKRYDKHPLVNFFNLGLTQEYSKLSKCPQLFVSINTDDQGVFGTYLENEYALMSLALEKVKDGNDQSIYNQEMIYDWLDKIREMGLQQSFLENYRKQ